MFIFSLDISAQVTEEWVARYNGPGSGVDGAGAVVVDSSGNVYVTGSSRSSGIDSDSATIKYNSSGVEQWVARYNGTGNDDDGTGSIAIDSSGNVYVTGSSVGLETNKDYITIKYNNSGVEQWVARYNGTSDYEDGADSIAIDSSGNVYVTGYSHGSGTYDDYVTIKYNNAGVEQWIARYNGIANDSDYANAIAIDSSGNVYVTGSSEGLGIYFDYVTIKYNNEGVEQWVERYNATTANYSDGASAIAVDSSGNVYVTGSSRDLGNIDDYATIKYNSLGVEEWVARYCGVENGYDYAFAIAIDSSRNVYVTGASAGSGTNLDYVTIKYNNEGVEQWVARYNGPGNEDDSATTISVDNLGNVYVTGYSYGSGTYDDYATIKYNNSGVEQWVARYNGPGNGSDIPDAIAIDSSGNVYVTGIGEVSVTDYDYVTIKYSQSTFSESFYLY